MTSNNQKIRITWDDVNAVRPFDPPSAVPPPVGHLQGAGARSWGSITGTPTVAHPATPRAAGIFLKGWFYLGVAGFLGAFLAWGLCEPSFNDVGVPGLGNFLMFPVMVILMCIGFGMAESLVERSWPRAIQRGLASFGLGIIMGFIFDIASNFLFHALIQAFFGMAPNPDSLAVNPVFWFIRSLAWAVFGAAGGIIFGIVTMSGRKTLYGVLGGVIGAGVGGLLFDPIALVTQGGEASRMIGMSILGACTGVAIGLVESALKDRWLYVSSGPLAGKQFILYQDVATIGKSQANTIYLFKDPDVLDHHATIENKAGKSFLTAFGQVGVSGQVVHGGAQRLLRPGDLLQIGRYTFSYDEKDSGGAQP